MKQTANHLLDSRRIAKKITNDKQPSISCLNSSVSCDRGKHDRVVMPEEQREWGVVRELFSSEVDAVIRNESGTVCYPIRSGICDLRAESARDLDKKALQSGRTSSELAVSEEVSTWYDQFGWQPGKSGRYQDSEYFSSNVVSSYGLYESVSHFDQRKWFHSGKYFLDAASGAIAHREYLAYSEEHEYRVCVDFSEVALLEAQRKIGSHGLFVLANVCELPFKDGVFSGVMSGYTVQHIHLDGQAKAIEELYRVLGHGHRLCIMTTQIVGKFHQRLFRLIRRLTGSNNSTARLDGTSDKAPEPPFPLYGGLRSYDWWLKECEAICGHVEIHMLRFLSKNEYESCAISLRAMTRIRALELWFSKSLARHSDLVSVILSKD